MGQQKAGVVLHLVPGLHVGGVNKSLVMNVQALASGRFEHVVCSVTGDATLAGEFEALGIPLVTLGHTGMHSAPRTLARLRRLVSQRGVTVIHSHLRLGQVYGGVVGRLCGIPNVTTYHWIDDATVHGVDQLGQRLTTRFVAVSDAVRDSMVTHRRLPSGRIEVVQHCVDAGAFDDLDAAAVGRIRASLLQGRASLVVNVGRLVPEKSQALLVPITRALVEKGFDVVTVIAGDGMLHDALRDQIDAGGLSDRILLLGRRSDVRELLSAADVVAITSSSEGFSIVALEAMAARRAVVASAIPTLQEVICGGTGGLLVPAGDADAFAAGIGGLLEAPARARQLGERARARVEEDFGPTAFVRRMEAVYEGLPVAGRFRGSLRSHLNQPGTV